MDINDLIELTKEELLSCLTTPSENQIYQDIHISFKIDAWFEIVDNLVGNDFV